MAKARRQVEEKLKWVDIVFELLDARLPLSSRNPMMDEIVKEKPRLVLLTKCDLADEKANRRWIEHFRRRGIEVLSIDAQTGKGVNQILPMCENILAPLFAAREKKGIQSKKFRAMVVGIPNVGKSSLINRLAKRSATVTGDRPGVTKAQQWIRIGKTLELLDTPGILWPKFDDPTVGLRLAASGAIKEEILPLEEVALYAVGYLKERYPGNLKERYKLKEISGLEGIEVMEAIGKKRGCLIRGGEIDYEKTAEILLHDLRSGRIGRITLEFPEDWEKDEEKADEENDTGDQSLVGSEGKHFPSRVE
jgi:ribosome biogenesis GTPase A